MTSFVTLNLELLEKRKEADREPHWNGVGRSGFPANHTHWPCEFPRQGPKLPPTLSLLHSLSWAMREKDANMDGEPQRLPQVDVTRREADQKVIVKDNFMFHSVARTQRPCGVMGNSSRFGAQRPGFECRLY